VKEQPPGADPRKPPRSAARFPVPQRGAYSRKLDNFFSDPKPRLRLHRKRAAEFAATSRFSRAASARARQNVHANISLPNTEDRLKLVVQRGVRLRLRRRPSATSRMPPARAGGRTRRAAGQQLLPGSQSLAAEVLGWRSARGGSEVRPADRIPTFGCAPSATFNFRNGLRSPRRGRDIFAARLPSLRSRWMAASRPSSAGRSEKKHRERPDRADTST